MKSQKKAFTLAEVLIVLVIVAIVAAIVLPGMYKKIKKQSAVAMASKVKYALELGCQQTIDEFNDPAQGNEYSVNKVLLTNNWKNRIVFYAGAADNSGKTELKDSTTFQMKKSKVGFTVSNVNTSGTGKFNDSTVVFRAKITPNNSTAYTFDILNDCNLSATDTATRNLVNSGFKAD